MEKAKIMIVEDETFTAMSLQRALRLWGYEACGPVATGQQAIKGVERQKPDLVIMDILLAGSTDGIEAPKEIRKHYGIPIIFLTAYQDDEILERAKNVKSSTCLVKPLEPDRVQLAIDQAFQKHEGHFW